MKRKYFYFVSFNFGNCGFANCEVAIDKKIESFNDLNDIKKHLEATDKRIKNIVILNYILLKKPSKKVKESE